MSAILLIGGVRSGKSTLAVRLGRSTGDHVTFVATARNSDDEMRSRIERHRAARPDQWDTLEVVDSQLDVAIASIDPTSAVIVDCLNLWVSNEVVDGTDEQDILERARRVADALSERSRPTITVTNEVGAGVHPTTAVGRRFRDVLGSVNQIVSEAVDECLLVVAGRSLRLSRHDETVEPW